MIYEFTPTQDLHGYAEPWAPGAGKNKFDFEGWLKTNNAQYTKSGDTYTLETYSSLFYNPFVFADENTKCTLSIASMTQITAYNIRLEFLATDGTVLSTLLPGGSAYTAREAAKIRFNWARIGSFSIKEPMLEMGATKTAFAPYTNVCPPEGYNIWDPSQEKMIPVYSGYVDAEGRKLYLHPVYEEYDGEELVGPWMSSLDKYTEEGTPTAGAFVVDFGGEVTEYDITDFMLQTLLDSLGVRRFITSGAMLLNSLMDQAQGRVRSEEELLNRSLPLHVIAIGEDLPTSLVIKKPVSDVLPGLPGKFIR